MKKIVKVFYGILLLASLWLFKVDIAKAACYYTGTSGFNTCQANMGSQMCFDAAGSATYGCCDSIGECSTFPPPANNPSPSVTPSPTPISQNPGSCSNPNGCFFCEYNQPTGDCYWNPGTDSNTCTDGAFQVEGLCDTYDGDESGCQRTPMACAEDTTTLYKCEVESGCNPCAAGETGCVSRTACLAVCNNTEPTACNGTCRQTACIQGELEASATCPSGTICCEVPPPIRECPGTCRPMASLCGGGEIPIRFCPASWDLCCVDPSAIFGGDIKAGPPAENCGGDGIGFKTAIGCIPVDKATAFATFFLRWGMGIMGGAALFMIGYSGFMIIASSGDPKKIQAGKELLTASVSGVILLLFGIFALRFIGIEILGLNAFGFGS